MKKIFLSGLITFGICTSLWAQQKDTVTVRTDSATLVKKHAYSCGDTSIRMEGRLDTKREWEEFFKELGGGLYELSLLCNNPQTALTTTHPKDSTKRNAKAMISKEYKNKGWRFGMQFNWGFLAWNGDLPSFTKYFIGMPTEPETHISFSALSFEASERYWFNSHHAVKLGIGLAWDNYRSKIPGHYGYYDYLGIPATKVKYTVTYVTAPIGYQFSSNRSFGFHLELIPGYATNAHVKLKGKFKHYSYRETDKQKYIDMENVNLFKLDARASVDFSWGELYVQQSLLPVLDCDGEKKLYPIRAGFAIDLY
jgi:hypothetical protein